MSNQNTESKITPPAPGDSPDAAQAWLDIVRHKVASLRYGVVQIIVHDGKVTQIEHTEKTRLVSSRNSG
jgi:hypothetical protein